MFQRIGAMIGSPGDATEERQAITETILRWNAANSSDKGVMLEPVRWETHATPGLEGRPQGMINEELIPRSDFLIAVFRVRAGSPTGKEISGTIEEIREFMRLGKYVAVYFYEGETSVKGLDPEQLQKVHDFKKEIQQHGLTETYTNTSELQAKLALHLTAIVSRLAGRKTGARASQAASSKGKRRTLALPKARPIPATKKPQGKPPAKDSGGKKSKAVVAESGRWVLLDTKFYEARMVKQKDRTITIEIPSNSAEIDAALSGLRPHHFGKGKPIPFPHGNDAWTVTVKEVESVSEGKGQLWTLTLVAENIEYGGGFTEVALNVGAKHYSPNDVAKLRAGRILLNDPPPVEDKPRSSGEQVFLENAMLEAHIRGINIPVSVRDCIIRVIHNEQQACPDLFMPLARLAAIYFLKAGGVVEQVRQLSLGPIRKGKLHVKFRGVRRRRAINEEPAVIEIEGDCPLD